MARFFRLFLLLAISALSSGCAFFLPDRIHYTVDEAVTTENQANTAIGGGSISKSRTMAPTQDGLIVGVGLSGGGSRASVFGAAALEVLAEAGVLDQTTYLSSVSGGGFPATYYALKNPKPCKASISGVPCRSESFDKFKIAMRQNFLTGMFTRQFAHPNRLSSPTRRVSSLQDALDDAFINNATFADLPPTPILLINGARYDDARRFVFSNEPIPEVSTSEQQQFSELTLRTASFSQDGCTRATPPDFSLSLAATVSASFPPLLGPVSIEAPSSCNGGSKQFWHLGDGGILDNTGVETIEDYALRADIGDNPVKRVVIFSVDSGASTPSDIMMEQRNLGLWTGDPGRVVEIVGKRAQAYRRVALGALRPNSNVEFLTIHMRYTDAKVIEWPPACRGKKGGPDAIAETIRNVPLSLSINDCNAELLELAARDVVRRSLIEHRLELQRFGVTIKH